MHKTDKSRQVLYKLGLEDTRRATAVARWLVTLAAGLIALAVLALYTAGIISFGSWWSDDETIAFVGLVLNATVALLSAFGLYWAGIAGTGGMVVFHIIPIVGGVGGRARDVLVAFGIMGITGIVIGAAIGFTQAVKMRERAYKTPGFYRREPVVLRKFVVIFLGSLTALALVKENVGAAVCALVGGGYPFVGGLLAYAGCVAFVMGCEGRRLKRRLRNLQTIDECRRVGGGG